MNLRTVAIIASQTFTEARRNRVFYSIFLFALVIVLNSILFTEVTIVSMDRVLKDTGMASINVFTLALTIFTGVGVINREVDRRSLYAILAKPIGRHVFILGKYLGMLAVSISTSFLMLLALFVAMRIYRVPITGTVMLGYFGVVAEVAVLGAFALLCSSFTNAVLSAFLTGAVFIAGHLSTELLFFARKAGPGTVQTLGKAIYYFTPNLERFNFKYNVTYDLAVDSARLLASGGYALAYVASFLVAAIAIFSVRDFR